MREVRRWGVDVHDKNCAYSAGNHIAMLDDDVRRTAFATAIGRAAKGRRVLDVGSGPFLLLARLCERAGARFVACVEESRSSIRLAIELLKHEQRKSCPESGWRLDDELVEECKQHLGAIERSCGTLLQLRALQIPLPDAAPSQQETLRMLAATVDDAAVLALYEGLSTHTPLPGAIELVVHEILGHVCSAEGVVGAMRELHARPGLLAPGCAFIPRAAGTMVAPTALLEPQQLRDLELRRLVPRTLPDGRRWDVLTVVDATGGGDGSHGDGGGGDDLGGSGSGVCGPAPLALYHVDGFPADNVLAAPQPMEWYEFDGGGGGGGGGGAAADGDGGGCGDAHSLDAALPTRQQRTASFTTERGGRFDGLRLHLVAQLDAETRLDASAAPTTWSCLYIRLLPVARSVWLPAGSTVRCNCTVDAGGVCCHYRVEVAVAPPGEPPREVAEYTWSGDG